MKDANYRKHNDHSHNSSTYHKKDGTPVRAILKREAESEIKDAEKAELIKLDPCPDANGNATIRWDDGSENGNTEKQPIATVYDWDDAQGIVDAWNAAQLKG